MIVTVTSNHTSEKLWPTTAAWDLGRTIYQIFAAIVVNRGYNSPTNTPQFAPDFSNLSKSSYCVISNSWAVSAEKLPSIVFLLLPCYCLKSCATKGVSSLAVNY